MTVGDRQREAGMACASQFPGSVASKVNLKNEDCGCPSGTTWDGPGKKRCIPSTAQQRPSPTVSSPAPDLCVAINCIPQRAQGPVRDLRGQLPPRAPGVRRGPYTAGTGR